MSIRKMVRSVVFVVVVVIILARLGYVLVDWESGEETRLSFTINHGPEDSHDPQDHAGWKDWISHYWTWLLEGEKQNKENNMNKRRQMYELLEQMLENAEKGAKETVLELNRSFEKLVPHVFGDPPTELDLEYDNCRQSCILQYIPDARERFARIPKPQD